MLAMADSEQAAYTEAHVLAYPVEYIAGIDLYNAREFHAAHDERAEAELRAGEAATNNSLTTTTNVGLVIVRDVRLLLIAIWLGAAVGFSFAVAPSAFVVLPTHELAGNLVTRTLGIVNVA